MIHEQLRQRLLEHDKRVALIQDGQEYRYRDLIQMTEERQRLLVSLQIAQHQVVVLKGDFSVEAISWLLALYQNRNVVVPATALTELGWQALNDSCAPHHLIDCHDGWKHSQLVPPGGGGSTAEPALLSQLRQEQAAGLILLSSGSTGRPKVILHNLDSLVQARLAKGARSGLSIMLFLLFDHIGGMNSLLNTLIAGSPGVVVRRRTPDEVCALVERHKVRVLPTSPTFLNLILLGEHRSRYDLSSLRLITYGTETMPEQLLHRVRASFPQCKLLQTFGTSETGISTTVSRSSDSTFFRIDDRQFDWRVVNGELQLRSKTQFLGYLNHRSEVMTDDGWFKTGDLVEQGEDGFFRIQGRSSEVINVGGEKVLPLELESILLSHPLIEDCLIYGEPNAITGQHVCAEVRVRGEVDRRDVRGMVQSFLAERVEAFKVPAKIRIVDSVAASERFKKRRVAG